MLTDYNDVPLCQCGHPADAHARADGDPPGYPCLFVACDCADWRPS